MWILSLYCNIFLLIYLGSSSDIVGSGDYEEVDQTEVTTSVGETNFDTNNEDSNSKVDRENKMENTHVKINHEMENMILDQIDAKLAALEDIRIDAVILERHMDKHSNFSEYPQYRSTIESIEKNLIGSYQEELNLMKRKIIGSNHELAVEDVEEMNKWLDNTEEAVQDGRDMIDNFIDVHVESEAHEHEHDHTEELHHHQDDFADYSDLLTMDDEATEEEVAMLHDSIDKELEDLEEVEQFRDDLEDHFEMHKTFEHIDTHVPEAVLDQVNSGDLQEFKIKLKNMKKILKESEGRVDLDLVDSIVSILDRANIFVEISKQRLEVADLLDADADLNAMASDLTSDLESEELNEDVVAVGEETIQGVVVDEIAQDELKRKKTKKAKKVSTTESNDSHFAEGNLPIESMETDEEEEEIDENETLNKEELIPEEQDIKIPGLKQRTNILRSKKANRLTKSRSSTTTAEPTYSETDATVKVSKSLPKPTKKPKNKEEDEREFSDEVKAAFQKAADNAHEFLHKKNLIHHEIDEEELMDQIDEVIEEKVQEELEVYGSYNYCLALAVVCVLLILVAVVVARTKLLSDSDENKDTFHEIGGICSPPQEIRTISNHNYGYETSVPTVSNVTESNDVGWNRRNWNQDSYKEPYKRK